MSRLDAPVSGVLLFARTSKAAARLTEQFRTRAVEKLYWALVSGDVDPATDRLVEFVRADERHRRMHRTRADQPGAQEARLTYRRLTKLAAGTLLEVELETGRKHQIRLQLSGAAGRSWAIANTAVRSPSPQESPCTAAAWRLRTRHATSASNSSHHCRQPG